MEKFDRVLASIVKAVAIGALFSATISLGSIAHSIAVIASPPAIIQ